jgi:transcriptional regulator with XRE-family HTH domain
MKTLGDRIRELRNTRDLSLRELAKIVGVSAPFLTDVEQGRRFPKDATLENLARALRINLSDLKTHDTRPPAKEMTELSDQDIKYAFAFRRVVQHVKDKKLPPEEIIRRIEKANGRDAET